MPLPSASAMTETVMGEALGMIETKGLSRYRGGGRDGEGRESDAVGWERSARAT